MDHFASIISGAAVRKAHNYWAERLKGLADREGWSPDAVGTLLLAWPDNRETWTTAAKLGQSVERSYWQRKYPYSPDGDAEDLKFVARQYLSVDRASAAIGALQKNINELPVDLVFDLLDAVIPEVNRRKTPVNNMLVYHLEKIFELLEKKKDVAAEDIARREYAYLPLLKNRKKSLMLHRIMAESPQFYISVISDVFKGASAETEEQTEEKRTRASAGYRLLSSFKTVPGEKDGAVDITILRDWIQGVREKAAEADRTRIVDQYVGHILAHAPPDKNDGAWPHQAIRTILEKLDSDDVERGLSIERFNMRGVFGKTLYEGGLQERAIAEQYRNWAKAAVDWPRTSAMLERIAQNYDHDANQEDIRAQQDQMRY